MDSAQIGVASDHCYPVTMLARILLLSTLLAFAANAEKKPFTTDTIWDWRTLANPQISPDGRAVLYSLGWNDKLNDAMYANLWTVGADGKDARPVTQGAYRDTAARWSPDGTRIAFLSNRSGKTQIHVRWMDSGQEARITDGDPGPGAFEWSPDGQSIAFTARVPAKPAWTVKLPEKPAGARWADPPIVVTRLHWRQDGAGLVPAGFTHIFVVPATGGTPRQITTGDFDHQGIAWTPDSASILTSAVRRADADHTLEGPDIWSFLVKDSTPRQLTSRKGPDTGPVVSPDGKKVAYTGFDFRMQSYHVTGLYVMDLDGGNSRRLATKHDRDVLSPRWSADSSSIYFLSDSSGSAQLYRARLDGTVEAVTRGAHRLGTGYAAADSFTLAKNGRVAVIRSTPAEPPDVVTFSVDRPAELTRVTQANDSLMVGRTIGAVEEITYDSFDGKPIQGWIVKPPNFDPARKYPLILDIHGGPHAMYGIEFGNQFQMYAARGFVVLYTNPRGSTGYGEDFGNIIHAKYPGDDYQDLMAGVDVLLKKGYIDQKKLCVTGGSGGGGLLTAWIIGHTDRFAAAVSQYPVTNWITQAGTADFGLLFSAVWMKAMPWENPKQYIERSPIFFAQNFKTPTMVLTGEADYRTPMPQSEELYFALKSRQVDSVLVRIPDEPHGIRGIHPSHRIEKVEFILAWMEKYTQ